VSPEELYFLQLLQSKHVGQNITSLDSISLFLPLVCLQKSTKTVYSGCQSKLISSLQQSRLAWMFLSPCVCIHTPAPVHRHRHTSPFWNRSGLLWAPALASPPARLPAHPAALPAPQPCCTGPGRLRRDLWLPRPSFNPIRAPFLNQLPKLQMGL